MRKLILTPFDKATRAYVRLENGGPIQNQISRHSRVFESGRPIFDRFLQISIDSRDEYHGNERFFLSLSLSLEISPFFRLSSLPSVSKLRAIWISLSLSLFPFPWLVCRAANSLWKLHRVPELVNETATIKRDTLVEAQRGNG